MSMKTYTSQQPGVLGFLRELRSLYRRNCVDNAHVPSSRVGLLLDDVRRVENRIRKAFDKELEGMSILEIGPGPYKIQMTYLAQRNQVVAIDLDVIPDGWDVLGYLHTLRHNGVRRFIKTIGRKTLGIDRRYRSELTSQLKLPEVPKSVVMQMDVCKMSFPAESFDFVYARSVFHSLPDPGAGLDEVVRVLKPGGVAYISIHLFTSPTGSLDLRIYTDRDNEARMWPHLRPQLRDTVRSATYVNKLRLEEWRRLFEEKMPGVTYTQTTLSDSKLEVDVRSLQAKGDLGDYSMEELLTYELDAMWRKPAAPTH